MRRNRSTISDKVAGWLTCAVLALPAVGAPPTVPDEGPATDGGSLTIRVSGLRSSKGYGAFAVYGSEEAFKARDAAVAKGRVEVVDGTCEWTADALVAGAYAVAFYHDRNDNGRLDKNKLGAPREPYGFSQNARKSFGPPAFAAARFEFDGSAQTIEIEAR